MMTPGWSRWLRPTLARAARLDALEVLPLLTIVLLLLRSPSAWYLQIPLTIVCIVGLVYRQVLPTSRFWYLVAALLGTTVYLNWATAVDQDYLIGYWCLALCTTFSLPAVRQGEALRLTSRWLVALCMIWAVFWKLASDSYLDGTFFHQVLLLDERFAHLAGLIGDVPSRALVDNRQLRDLLVSGYLQGVDVNLVALADTWQLRTLARLLTWWLLLMEAALAVTFAWPGQRFGRMRHGLLLLYGVTSCAGPPAAAFGWVLMLLGLAHCRREEKWSRLGYLAVFLLVPTFSLPWGQILLLIGNQLTGNAGCGV